MAFNLLGALGAGANVLGGFFNKKASKNAANELQAMSPFNPFQQQAMSNLYTQRATEDPSIAAKRQVQFAQEQGKPRMAEMAEQFSANVGQRMGTGGSTGNAGFINKLGERQFADVFREGGLADLGAINSAYQNQLGALSGGLGMQQQYNQNIGQNAVQAKYDSSMSIPTAIAGGIGIYGDAQQSRRNQAMQNQYMKMIGTQQPGVGSNKLYGG
jgi:hypothetical protein